MLFKKKKRYSDYIIDLGKLKSRGIIPEQSADSSPTSTETTSSEGFGFLGTLASASPTSDSTSSPSDSTGNYGSDERDLPLSLRDKIRSISEKLYKVLDRIDLLEHKINRIERRLNLQSG